MTQEITAQATEITFSPTQWARLAEEVRLAYWNRDWHNMEWLLTTQAKFLRAEKKEEDIDKSSNEQP